MDKTGKVAEVEEEEVEVVLSAARPLFSSPLDGKYNLPKGLGQVSVFTRSRRRDDARDTDAPGKAMLFVDDIWPAAYCLSDYMCRNPQIVEGKVVLELGAGAALPSCVAAKLGAKKVVISDYPAAGVIETISEVIKHNNVENNSIALPYIWGESPDCLLSEVDSQTDNENCENSSRSRGFDLMLLADLLWRDTYKLHRELLTSMKLLLKNNSKINENKQIPIPFALVAFAHRPCADHGPEQDLEFFQIAKSEFGWESLLIEVCDKYGDAYSDGEPVDVYLYGLFA